MYSLEMVNNQLMPVPIVFLPSFLLLSLLRLVCSFEVKSLEQSWTGQTPAGPVEVYYFTYANESSRQGPRQQRVVETGKLGSSYSNQRRQSLLSPGIFLPYENLQTVSNSSSFSSEARILDVCILSPAIKMLTANLKKKKNVYLSEVELLGSPGHTMSVDHGLPVCCQYLEDNSRGVLVHTEIDQTRVVLQLSLKFGSPIHSPVLYCMEGTAGFKNDLWVYKISH